MEMTCSQGLVNNRLLNLGRCIGLVVVVVADEPEVCETTLLELNILIEPFWRLNRVSLTNFEAKFDRVVGEHCVCFGVNLFSIHSGIRKVCRQGEFGRNI